MSLITQRLVSKKACYMQCRRAFNQRSYYGTATLPNSVARAGNEDSSSTSSSSRAGTPRAPKDIGTNFNSNESTTAPMMHSKIQAYLDEVENTSVTVQDLEQFKPDNYGKPGTPQYEKDYNSLLANILRCFSATQLRDFAKLYKLPSGKRAAKRDYAVAIIEHAWKLPSLTKVQMQEMDSKEVARQEFILDPSQCFLLLGKDGSYLHDLSSKYNVHVSLSAAPLRLNVEGVKTALDKLSEHITGFKEDIDSQLFDIGNVMSMSDELLYHISRKSGAFIQYINKQQLSITYRKSNPSAFDASKRLLTMAIAEQHESKSMLLYQRAEEADASDSGRRSFASYPFTPAYTHSQRSTRSLFRLRKVKDSTAYKSEDAEMLVKMPNVIDVKTKRVANLQDKLIDAVHTENIPLGFTRIIKATPGHLLWSSSNANESLIPELARVSTFENVEKWISDHHASGIFFSSSPTIVLSTPAKHQKILRRLTYISSLPSELTNGSQNVIFEIILNSKSYPPVGNTWSEDNLPPDRDFLKAVCHINAGVILDLMLPDRTMDIRFSVTDSAALMRSGWPVQLEEYYNRLKIFLSNSQEVPQPEIPLGFRYNNSEFILRSSDTVRQSLKSVQSGLDATTLDVVTETIASTEDDESSRTLCQIECTDLNDASWRQFLRNCVLLTTH